MVLAALTLLFQNCGDVVGKTEAASTMDSRQIGKNQIEQRYALIRSLAARDLACSKDADCVTVPVGSRPCGGPSDYLVTSVHNPDLEQVRALAVELEMAEREYNRSNELVGTCDFRMPPETSCGQGLCRRSDQG
ncbi:MAG: hypothetical protein HC902_01430 [Calothrix sp. SM1_5_4]|nr:hypothetical protein [Calothrix sp. SM1_5_4]